MPRTRRKKNNASASIVQIGPLSKEDCLSNQFDESVAPDSSWANKAIDECKDMFQARDFQGFKQCVTRIIKAKKEQATQACIQYLPTYRVSGVLVGTLRYRILRSLEEKLSIGETEKQVLRNKYDQVLKEEALIACQLRCSKHTEEEITGHLTVGPDTGICDGRLHDGGGR